MIKRIFAAIMAAILLLPAGVSASKTETEISTDLEFAKALGIMSDECVADEPVTRIELAKSFCNILYDNIDVAGTTVFEDVSEEDAVYAESMKNLGIMVGVSEKSFNPGGKVTYAQLLKAFVAFLGYDVEAQKLGGYPVGYLAVATQLRLIKNPPESYNYYVTNAKVASLFKLASNVSIMEIVKFGSEEYKYIINPDETYLTYYMGINYKKGIVNANFSTNLINGNSVKVNDVYVGNEVFSVNDSMREITTLVGHSVYIFYEETSSGKNILYFEKANNNVLKIDARDVHTFKGFTLVYSAGRSERKEVLRRDIAVVYNSTLATSYDDNTFNPFDNLKCDGNITLVDNTGDGVYDVCFIEAYETYVVDKLINGIIYPKYREGAVIDVSFYIDGEDILFRNVYGEPVSIESIEEDDILSVYYDKSGKPTQIIVTVDTYMGILKEISKSGDRYELKIDDTVFDTSASFAKSTQIKKMKIGDKVVAYFNKNALISDIKFQSQWKKLGLVTDAKKSDGLSEKYSLRIFDSDSVFRIYDLTKKVSVNYGLREDSVPASEIIEMLGYEGGRIRRQPVYYKVNDAGEIIHIEICDESSGPIDGFYRYTLWDDSENTPTFRTAPRSFQGQLLFSTDAVIFNIPPEDERDSDKKYSTRTSYTIYSGQYFPTKDLKMYGNKKDSRMAYVGIIISGGFTNDTITEFTAVCAVNDVRTCVDADGEEYIKITGFEANKEYNYLCGEDIYKEEFGNTKLEKGDVIRVSANDDGVVKMIQHVFDESERDMPRFTQNPTAKGYTQDIRYSYGNVIYGDSDMFTLEMYNKADGKTTIEYYTKQMKTVYYYKYEKINDKYSVLRKAGKEEILDAATFGADAASKLFIHTYYGDIKTVVIYD